METLNDLLKRVAVLGASGKMGRGITLLLLQEMALCQAKNHSTTEAGLFRLYALDLVEDKLFSLRTYLRSHLRRFAEKKIVQIRAIYADRADLPDNAEVIQEFVDTAMDMVLLDTHLPKASNAYLIFEAVSEDVRIKIDLYRLIASDSKQSHPTYYFSNTSSIPISVLDEEANLKQNVIGFHFYNPPPVQRLIEIVTHPHTNPRLIELANDLGTRLKKTIISSNDVAGFIGNGHFMRELVFLDRKLNELTISYPWEQSIYMLNRVTQDFMIRPMGMFQLIDYVGLDVCQNILTVMAHYLPDESFKQEAIDQLLVEGKSGGQRSNGSQKDGFFRYQNGSPRSIYSMQQHDYILLEKTPWVAESEQILGSIPYGSKPWKDLIRHPEKKILLKKYFDHLFQNHSLGAVWAKEFLLASKSIAEGLVQHNVAQSVEDVNIVLQRGFSHVYGASTPYF